MPTAYRLIILIALVMLLLNPSRTSAATSYADAFTSGTMRVDYYHTGNWDSEMVTLDRLSRYAGYAGNPAKPIDAVDVGNYNIKIFDSVTSDVLYTRTFNSIFEEYQQTQAAHDGKNGTYYETALIPQPKRRIAFTLEKRDPKTLKFKTFYTLPIDPSDNHIKTRQPHPQAERIAFQESGKPADCLDITFVSEGYTAAQRDKFLKDGKAYMEEMFLVEPYKSHRNKINIWGVFCPSADSGVTQPELRNPIYKSTLLDAAFNALDTARYLLVNDLRTLNDVALAAPYDKLVVLANETRYGGGGIYNYYTISTVDNAQSRMVFMHEFGHACAALADEYYNADVAYVDAFPAGIEPREANITRLLDPKNIKWKALVTPGVPIPTPWGKEEVESLRAQLRGADQAKRTELNTKIREITKKYNDLYAGKIGAFEGGGYNSTGIYRSEIHNDFYNAPEHRYGKVSEAAILEVVLQYIN